MHCGRAVISLAIAALFGQVAHSQVFIYGLLSGVVMDTSEAAVPKATVVLVNEGTGDRRTTVTDSAGRYRFLDLVPANYRLEAEALGFKRFTLSGLTLEVDKAIEVDVNASQGVNQ